MVELNPGFIVFDNGEESRKAVLDFVIDQLRAGTMTPECQRWLAKCFDAKSDTVFRLKAVGRRGQHKGEDRFLEFREKIEPFRMFRESVLKKFQAEIEREGEDAVVLKQAEMSKKDSGFGVSRPTAKKLLDFIKIDEETRREAQQEWLAREKSRQNEEAIRKPK
jgi:hypothetical protein